MLRRFVCEDDLESFLCDAGRFNTSDEDITLDFKYVQFWIPSAIVYLCALAHFWNGRGRKVFITNHLECKAFSYLQRIDFFEQLKINLPENFRRHDAGANFVEIAQIPIGTTRLSNPLTQRLARCLAGDTGEDARQMAEFAFGEMIANVQQHSGTEGFCSAQYTAKHDWARIGVGDAGMGVLGSFRNNRAPIYAANPGMSHSEALENALRPWVSSRKHLAAGTYGAPPNRGVGLNMVQHMIHDSSGEMIVATGDAMVRFHGDRPQKWSILQCPIPGTLVSILFPRSNVPSYYQMVADAQAAIDLMPDGDNDRFFI